MQIVIDIPKEIYEASQILEVKYEDVIQIPLECIANGTPILKGHGRLIDADKLKEVFSTTEDADYCQWNLNGIISEIDDALTIIETEAKE